MRKFLINLVILSSTLISCVGVEEFTSPEDDSLPATPTKKLVPSDFPNVKNSLLGVWTSDMAQFEPGGIAKFYTFYFNRRGEMGLSVSCVGNNQSGVASGTVTVTIRANQILLSGPMRIQYSNQDGSFKCGASLRAGIINYSLTESNRLRLKLVDRETENFSRVQ